MNAELEELLCKLRSIRKLDMEQVLLKKRGMIKKAVKDYGVGFFVISVTDYKSEVAFQLLEQEVGRDRLIVFGEHGTPIDAVYSSLGYKTGSREQGMQFVVDYVMKCEAAKTCEALGRVVIADTQCKEDILISNERKSPFCLFDDMFLSDVLLMGEALGVGFGSKGLCTDIGVSPDFIELYLSVNDADMREGYSLDALREYNREADSIEMYIKWRDMV